jgi:hypothetical protein
MPSPTSPVNQGVSNTTMLILAFELMNGAVLKFVASGYAE